MFGEAVGHLFKRKPDILHGNFLANHAKGDGRKMLVGLTQGAGQHRSIAHAGIENLQRRRGWGQVRQFHAQTLGHRPFFSTGCYEL